MTFFTCLHGGTVRRFILSVTCVAISITGLAAAGTDTNSTIPSPGEMSSNAATKSAPTNAPATNAPTTNAPATNAPPAVPATNEVTVPSPVAPVAPPAIVTPATPAPPAEHLPSSLPTAVLAALMTLASLGGFLLYQCGLTRAKNSGHTSTLLLIGALFGLTGYWIGGFAVQSGGIGDVHAALSQPTSPAETAALNHEFGPVLFTHHWGLMGSYGFFLATDESSRNGVAGLFLAQAALLTIVVAAALGASLERGKLIAMAFCAYLIGVLVYPLLANWVWGGGWLAELGREFGLGHGFVDLGGACVVHEAAGILALVLAIILGPRHGRFGRNKPAYSIPGHNVPFIIFGALILLGSWMVSNGFASASLSSDISSPDSASPSGLAAINTLLAAMGGIMATFIQTAVQKVRPDPARLCRGLLGGAVASCGGAGLFDPWAAFLIGCVAALLVQQAMVYLEQNRIDDPVGASAVHGAAGIWGALAVGLFANGGAGDGLNGVPHEVRGLFYGGAWHQLVAQILGCVTGFVLISLLGYACINLVQKILGNRVDLVDETSGLDWTEVGALGYQGDVEVEEGNGK